jgi:general secretion pathway protein K
VTRRRDGFALLTVLWIAAAASAIAMALQLSARDHVQAARNRVDRERAYWRANDCLERQRAAIDEILGANAGSAPRVWRQLDRGITPIVRADCAIVLEAAGARLDVNTASEDRLATFFSRASPGEVAGAVEAILDWRDIDDDARPQGAESDWYALHRRMQPRNGPFADVRELDEVRGLEVFAGLTQWLGVEAARIPLGSAPLQVLATVPGFTPELLNRIAIERENGSDILDILALASHVSPATRDSVMAYYPEIARLVTADPDSWIIRADGRAGSPPMHVVLEAKLVLRENTRAGLVRRRILE